MADFHKRDAAKRGSVLPHQESACQRQAWCYYSAVGLALWGSLRGALRAAVVATPAFCAAKCPRQSAMRLIALRIPRSAQAQGIHPCIPVRRIRLTLRLAALRVSFGRSTTKRRSQGGDVVDEAGFSRHLRHGSRNGQSPRGESGPRSCYARLPRRCRARSGARKA